MSRNRGGRRGQIAAPLLVGVLAVAAFLLVVYALRSPVVPGSGQLPGPAPTWGGVGSSSPSPASPSPTPSVAAATTSFLEMHDSATGARATAGSCAGTAATVELTSDGGSTWTPVSFGEITVREILSLVFVSDTQIDIVAKQGSACSPTMVTSYTAGQFWQAYPERLTSAVYIDPSAGSVVSIRSASAASPCAQILQVESSGDQVVIRCSDGIYQYTDGNWVHLTLDAAVAIAIDHTTGRIYGVLAGSANCDGVLIRSYVPTADGPQITDVGCVPIAETLAAPALEWLGVDSWFWNGGVLHASKDSGATWSSIA